MNTPIITPSKAALPPKDKTLVFLAGRCGSEDKRDEIIASVNTMLGNYGDIALVDPRCSHYEPVFNTPWEKRMIDHSTVFVCVLPIIMGRMSMLELGYWIGSRSSDPDAHTIIVKNNADRDLVNAVGAYLYTMKGGVFLVDNAAEVPHAIGRALDLPMRDPDDEPEGLIFLEEEVHDITDDVDNPANIIKAGIRYILKKDSKIIEGAKAGDIVEYDGKCWRVAYKPERNGIVFVKSKDKWYYYDGDGKGWAPYKVFGA
ncbi:MAG: hypothetical protein D6790_00775 [Caldilineae bacterium]|nr:MAG: hypothetical protein D6790_00775 [Caldilineae bacterium]